MQGFPSAQYLLMPCLLVQCEDGSDMYGVINTPPLPSHSKNKKTKPISVFLDTRLVVAVLPND